MAIEQQDWLDEAGANELARRIRNYWHERGRAPDVYVMPASVLKAESRNATTGDLESYRGRIYVIRSNITEKLPQRVTRAA